MSSIGYSTVTFATARRSALVTLLGIGLLGAPLAPALAQGGTSPGPEQSTAQAPSHQSRAARRAETVDQRITKLHAELKITPSEESDWQAVAQAMRANAATMQKLASEKGSQQNMTAVEDLQTYQEFAQAHLDGLKSLISSFQTLYNSMPDQQKKLADQVFQRAQTQRAG